MPRHSLPILRILLTLAACVGILEYRLRYRERAILQTGTVFDHRLALRVQSCGLKPDRTLGWVPTEALSGLPNRYRTQVTLTPGGFRSTGSTENANSPWLTVGDSYTFGDQVSDSDTWPSRLQAQTTHSVVNAGVCGYGLDQSVLRAEALIKELHPEVLILGVFYLGLQYDVQASQAAPYYLPKPYFRWIDSELELETAHLSRAEPWTLHIDAIHSALGRSFLADRILGKLAPKWWKTPLTEKPAEATAQDPAALACAILKRFKERVASRVPRTLVVLQYGPEPSPDNFSQMAQLKACGEKMALEIVDTWPSIAEVKKRGEKAYQELWSGGHMSGTGNQLVADLISSQLNKSEGQRPKRSLASF